MDETKEGKTIKAAETVFDIVEILESERALGLAEIADRLGYSESTVYYYLNTLNNRQAIRRTEDGYELGPAFLRFGQQVQQRSDLWNAGRQHVDDLARQTGFLACAAVEFEGKTVVVYTESGESVDDSDSTVRRGTQTSLHTTAYGKAILANQPSDEIETYLRSRDVPEFDHAKAQYETVRSEGYAFSAGAEWEGTRSIASPVVDDGETVLGSVGVTGPATQIEDPNKYKKERRFASETLDLVKRTADSIEDNF